MPYTSASKPAPKTPAPAPAPKSRAQLLRTRLTFAKYKIRTNQVTKRSSDVLSDYELSSSPDALRTSFSFNRGDDNLSTPRVPNITISSPSRHPVFVKANLDPFRPIGVLGQAPVTFAPPTQSTAVESRIVEGYEVRSSPPVQSASPQALTSPIRRAGTESKHERLQRLKEQSWRESNKVSGDAAKGLLELMSGRR